MERRGEGEVECSEGEGRRRVEEVEGRGGGRQSSYHACLACLVSYSECACQSKRNNKFLFLPPVVHNFRIQTLSLPTLTHKP